ARARDVYAGGLLAIGVSIALAWAVNHLIGDNTSDTLEGIFQLTAAATLFYVSSWITAKSQAQQGTLDRAWAHRVPGSDARRRRDYRIFPGAGCGRDRTGGKARGVPRR